MSAQAVDGAKFDRNLSELEFAGQIDKLRSGRSDPQGFLPFLQSGHSLYAGRGFNQIARMRGYLLASFEYLGLPDKALVDVFDILQNSQNPYLVAAAARALRGVSEADENTVRYLRSAITNIQYRDEALSFEVYAPDWPRAEFTSALEEIVETLLHLGSFTPAAVELLEAMGDSAIFNAAVRARAAEAAATLKAKAPPRASTCCQRHTAGDAATEHQNTGLSPEAIADIVLEDQSGQKSTFAGAFFGRPTVAAFFYSRCGNPNKCSLTVSKLAQMRTALGERGLADRVNVAAITYDPGHDTPERLRGYCANRGFRFDRTNRAWRTDVNRFHEVRRYFDLGASYVNSVVSRHDIEVFLLDSSGALRSACTKLQWDVDWVADQVAALVREPDQDRLPDGGSGKRGSKLSL